MRNLWVFILLLPLLSNLAHADWSEDSAVNNPVCTTFAQQVNARVASDDAGGVYVVWEDYRLNGNYYDIFLQRLDSEGEPIWELDGIPISTAEGYQGEARILPDGAGGCFLFWRDYLAGTYRFFCQRVDAAGQLLWGPAGLELLTTSHMPSLPHVISDGAEGIVLTWRFFSEGSYPLEVFAQRINAAGSKLWGPVGIQVSGPGIYYTIPSVCLTGDGNFVFAWRNSAGVIVLQRYNGYGIPLGSVVNACTQISTQTGAALVSDGAGGVIVAWQDRRNSFEDDIYAQHLDENDLALWAPEGVPICTAVYPQTRLRMVRDAAGGAIMVWHDDRRFAGGGGGGPANDVYGQHVGADGIVRWVADGLEINSVALGPKYPELIADGFGGAIVTWQDPRVDQYNQITDIYAQRIDADGNELWGAQGTPACTAGSSQSRPHVAADGLSGVFIAWHDHRSGDGADIHAQRLNLDGSLGGIQTGVTSTAPTAALLRGNYPNPFNPSTSIAFSLPEAGSVRLEIATPSGRCVRILSREFPAGENKLVWDGRDEQGRPLASGKYFYRLRARESILSGDMILLK